MSGRSRMFNIRISLLASVLVFGFILEPVFAQEAGNDYKVFFPVDSSKEIELEIAEGLQKRLKVNYVQQLVNDDPDDIMIAFQIAESRDAERPAVIITVDTTILARDKQNNGVPVSQSIRVYSIGDIALKLEKEIELLRWTNSWNARDFPFRVYFSRGRLTVAQVMTATKGVPVTEQEVTGAFTGVLQIWSIIKKELAAFKLLQGT